MNGKRKGSGYERHISKMLTKWATGQSKEDYFWRTPNSGAQSTLVVENHTVAGDVMPLKSEVMFMEKLSIEAKRGYNDALIDKIFDNNKHNTVRGFWIQAIEASRVHEKYPVLIVKKDRREAWIGIPLDLNELLIERLSSLRHVNVKFEGLEEFISYNLDEFLEVVTFETMKNALGGD
jgi:hypothetical protein